MGFLDDLPMASILAVASVVCIVIGYVSNDINLEDALVALGVATGGAGVLGVARNQAGRGVKR